MYNMILKKNLNDLEIARRNFEEMDSTPYSFINRINFIKVLFTKLIEKSLVI
jgi:hypothetical protein